MHVTITWYMKWDDSCSSKYIDMEVVCTFVFSTLLVSWPKPNIFQKLEGRVSTFIFPNPVLTKESLSFPVSLALRMLTHSLQLDPLQQSWSQSNLWILSQVKQPSWASDMLLRTVMISRANSKQKLQFRQGHHFPLVPPPLTVTICRDPYSCIYPKVSSLLLVVILPTATFTCTLQVLLFSLACFLCGGSGSVSQKRGT